MAFPATLNYKFSMIGNVNIKVRPLRFALLVDPGNGRQVREAIKVACGLWGGNSFPIIPIYKRAPSSWKNSTIGLPTGKEIVEGYLDAFDSDFAVQFCSEIPDYVSNSRLKVIKPDDIWQISENGFSPDPVYGLGMLDILHDVLNENFRYVAKNPLLVKIPIMPKKFPLFWASVFGEYPQHIENEVNLHFSAEMEIQHPDVTPELFEDLIGSNVLFPRRATTWSTQQYGRLNSGNQKCVFFMDASKVEDVVDYWNLRATGRAVLPLPSQFLETKAFNAAVHGLIDEVEKNATFGSHSPVSFICSRSSTMEQMTDFSRRFIDRPDLGKVENRYTLQHWYPRIWDARYRDSDGGNLELYGLDEQEIDIADTSDLEFRIKPLFPKFARDSWLRSGYICANEFQVNLYGASEFLAQVYPADHGVHSIDSVKSVGMWGDWRIGRRGLVRVVSDDMTSTFKIPTAEKVFFAWLADKGWTAQLSSSGILAKQIYKKLSGTPLLISDKSLLGLIEYMNGGSVSKDGSPAIHERIGGERELPVGEIKKRLAGRSKNSFRYDDFIKRGVFKLGLRVQCPNCLRNSWFTLGSLQESIECPKCLSVFLALGNVEKEGVNWYCRTAGPFSVPNYAEGAYSVLLTIDMLQNRVGSLLSTTAVTSFTASSPGKIDMEADLAIIWKSLRHNQEKNGILFGECKTFGVFKKKDFERMQLIGDSFPGAILVFSTLRETLTQSEIVALTRLAKRGRKRWLDEAPVNPVLVLTGNELLGAERPPLCWNEGDREKFRYIADLLMLSDATQQIYLKLPSWAEERLEKLRRMRR